MAEEESGMASEQQLEALLKGDTAALPTKSLNQQQLLDMATAVSLTVRRLDQLIEQYSDLAGCENKAREARVLLEKVRSSVCWLQAFGHLAAEDELLRRVIAAHCYANQIVILVQDMRRHRQEVWDALLLLQQRCAEDSVLPPPDSADGYPPPRD
jgi:hypothetical protein